MAMHWFARLRRRAQRLELEFVALVLVMRNPRTPRIAKALLWISLAYALSPIDLIPDGIPVLGLLDDLIIVPAGIWLALRLTPRDLLDASRREARAVHSRGGDSGGEGSGKKTPGISLRVARWTVISTWLAIAAFIIFIGIRAVAN